MIKPAFNSDGQGDKAFEEEEEGENEPQLKPESGAPVIAPRAASN